MDAHTKRQARRKVTLESLSLAVPIASAFFFSGEFIVAWPWQVSLLLALGVAVLPLAKAWNLAIDDDPRPREDFCPK